MMAYVGAISLVIGLFFLAVGVVGVIRLPDVYSRLHASGKVGTLGLFFLLIGGAFIMPAASLKLLALGLFMIFSAPLASHVIAMSTYRSKKRKESSPEGDTLQKTPA